MNQPTINSNLAEIFPRLQDRQKTALKRLGIKTALDLFYHFPSRYVTISGTKPLIQATPGDHLVLFGTIHNLKATKSYRSKVVMATARLEDHTGHIDLVWFNQPYIAKLIPERSIVKIEGKVADRKGKIYVSNPEFEILKKLPEISENNLFTDQDNMIDDKFITVYYPESRGITSKWLHHAIDRLFRLNLHQQISDPLPDNISTKLNLPSIADAMIWLHHPQNLDHSKIARKRLAFQEIFALQVINHQESKLLESEPGFSIKNPDIKPILDKLGFTLTDPQQQSINEILNDLKKPRAMNRLLEGDVGSGKTAVAALALYATATSNAGKGFDQLQAALMAPTEILARQHFEGMQKLLGPSGLKIGFLAGSGAEIFPSKLKPNSSTKISKAQLKRYVERGDVDLLIGTHALIQKTVQFKRLALVVIDEQHRFGVRQRQNLARNKDGILPHLLSMTATPIPRTLALTLYGDLDLSIIDKMPPGRKPVKTKLVTSGNYEKVWNSIRSELESDRQAYVICARKNTADPDKTDQLNLHSVEEVKKHLDLEEFKKYSVGELHGSMKAKQKDQIMEQFLNKEIDILVATTVVEVGVNVPNASIIFILDAERYGLSQLHQLRGRVLRSVHQPYCYLATNSKSEASHERLQIFAKTTNGFKLAEMDLQRRGPGALIGKRQSGLSDTAMMALQNLKLVQVAKQEAKELVGQDPEITTYPDLKNYLDQIREQLHLE